MTPQNTAERKSSFFYFLIFFIITVGLIMLSVFFGMQVPFKENDAMKDQIANMQRDQSYMQNFTAKMSDTQNLLDSINRPGVAQPELINGSITANLSALTQMLVSDSAHLDIYKNVVKNLVDLQDAKKQLRDAGSSDLTIGNLQKQVSDLTSKLQQANLLLTMQSQNSK
jgi:hypothetical protein